MNVNAVPVSLDHIVKKSMLVRRVRAPTTAFVLIYLKDMMAIHTNAYVLTVCITCTQCYSRRWKKRQRESSISLFLLFQSSRFLFHFIHFVINFVTILMKTMKKLT